MGYHGAHIAATAAAHRRRRLEEKEEESMTQYNDDNFEKWEFKIVRSDAGAFRNPSVLADLLEEEALAGWEMIEKFDNRRIRFRRPIEARKHDAMLPDNYDPYRTQYGTMATRMAVLMGVVMLLLGLGVFGYVSSTSGAADDFPAILPMIILMLVISLAVVFSVARSRG
ncbi:MAG: hypothetical protein HN413_00450 [Chloroflexi bacterium]|jgi:hypothetical protein|nr:hypothetical protein [Chloroflexota bacterium]